MADFEPKEWTAGQTDENVIHASDLERWQAGIEEAGGRWEGSWEDDKDTLTAEQLSLLETEIHKLVSTFEIKAVSDDTIPGVEEWNRIEQGIVRAIAGHVWNITWQWSDDYTTCTALFEDADTGDTETVECVITSVVTAPTCTEQGYTTFTATATLDGIDYTDPVIGDYVPATGHQWGEPEFDWAEDYESCQAVFTCEICGDKDTVDCTVTETAEGGHTATCTHDGQEYSDTVEPVNVVAFAVYCDNDDSLTFYTDTEAPEEGSTYKNKAVSALFTGFIDEEYGSDNPPPWNDPWSEKTLIVTIDESFKKAQPISLSMWFCDFWAATEWNGLDNINTSQVTNMSYMFNNCFNEETENPFTLTLNTWDTSKVTNMSCMFRYCTQLTSLDLSTWDTSKVTNMSYMFQYCSQLTSLDLNTWDTSKVTSLQYTFDNCTSLTDISALASWDVSAVTSLYSTFDSCTSLTDISALASWDVSAVTSLQYTFSQCTGLTDISALANWDVSAVTSLYSTFDSCTSLTDISALASWDVSAVTSLQYTFSQCTGLTDISALANWDVSAVTSLYSTFDSCTSLTDISALANWDVSAVMSLYSTFRYCSKITEADVSKWDTAKITNMSYMFNGCSALTTIYSDDSVFVTTKVTSGSAMFTNCTKLVGGNGTAYDSSNVTYTMAHVDTADNPGYFTQKE